MKKLFSAVAILAVLSAFTWLKPTTFNVDTNQSYLTWVGYKVNGKHNGDVKLVSGTMTVDNKKVTAGSFVMDMKSITVKDLQGEWAGKLTNHLKSDDFFSVEKNPTAKFEITKVTPASAQNAFDVTGKMTIKGITKDISFPATIVVDGKKLTVTGTLKLDRTKWDITYRSDLAGTAADKLISNEFEIGLNIVAAAK